MEAIHHESFATPNEIPAWIKKIRNYGVAASIALSTFLASCGTTPEGASKQKISVETLEKLPNLEHYEKITPDMMSHVIEALETKSDSFYLDIDSQNLNDQIQISKESDTANDDHHVESTYGFNRNDSIYAFTIHEIDEYNRLHNDTVTYKTYPTGPILSELAMRATKEVNDYHIEVDKKTGVILAYVHKKLIDNGFEQVVVAEGVQTKKKQQNEVNTFFTVVADGSVEKSSDKENSYKSGDAIAVIKKFDEEVSHRKDKSVGHTQYKNYYLVDKNGKVLSNDF